MVITEDIITTNANEEQRLGKKLFSCIVAIRELRTVGNRCICSAKGMTFFWYFDKA